MQAIDVSACDWTLEDDTNQEGDRCKVLTLSLIKPPVSQEDLLFKKGEAR